MWSVGRKRGRLYLGNRIALLQVAGHSLVVLEYPPTLPLSSSLQQLAFKCQQQSVDLSNVWLDVDLSSGLCKGVVMPSSFNSHDQSGLSPEARQTIARQLPWSSDHWAWPSGSTAAGLWPVTTQGLMRNLAVWAEAQKIRLGLVQPLWTLITQSRRATANAIRGIALAEPDGMVVLSTNESEWQNNHQATWHFSPHTESIGKTERLRDLMASHQLSQSTTAIFEFHSMADSGDELGLKAWAGHWGQV